jgi:hypothetical protein
MSSNVYFEHWNIFFRDIYQVSLEMVDIETGKTISHRDLERTLAGEDL